MRTLLVSMSAAILMFGVAAPAESQAREPSLVREEKPLKLRVKVGNKVISASLADSKSARDFASLLPLTLTMKDLFKREKFAHLPRELAEDGERARTYQIGQIIYWPPGPDVAIFYRHDGQTIPSPGIVVLGKVDDGVEVLNVPAEVRVTLELAD
jgi:hypothetical protein